MKVSESASLLAGELLNELHSDGSSWTWYEEDKTPDTGRQPLHLILGAVVVGHQGGGDWTEFALDVWRGVEPLRVVTAAVEVACWCPEDHNMHAALEHEWTADNAEALVRAVEEALAALANWWRQSTDADDWRRRAGLPPRGS